MAAVGCARRGPGVRRRCGCPYRQGGSAASRAERAAAGVDPVKGRCRGGGHGCHRAALGVDAGLQ
jgi:hypothetical protein